MKRIYNHTFPDGRNCEFELAFEGTHMSWSPGHPPQSWAHFREYRRWRDRCFRDYARRTGVLYIAQLDNPCLGVRGYDIKVRDEETAYAVMHARYAEMRNAHKRVESHPGVREMVLKNMECEMLSLAPHDTQQPVLFTRSAE